MPGGRAAAVLAGRLSVGPLALAGFFLPWAHGPGALAATRFSGFTLVGFVGRLRALDLAPGEEAALWIVRVLILGVAVAGVWQAVLAPFARWHAGYRISGWYVSAFAAVAAAVGLARAGITLPPAGLALVVLSGAVFAACEGVDLWEGRRATGR
ncbi:MAG: hypothetical protein ACR2NO_05420 [Chloroflexota bacterium]